MAKLTALTQLNLRECRLITNDGLRRLEPLVQLKTFSMSNCTSVTDKGLQSLAKLTGRILSRSSLFRVYSKVFQHLRHQQVPPVPGQAD